MSGPGSSQKADHSWKTREALSSIPAPKNLTKTAARLMKECWWLSGKDSACSAGDTGSIPGSRRFPGGGNDNPLQYSCLGNHVDRGARWATVHGVRRSQTGLSD